MVFSSLIFIFRFLPLSLMIYFFTPKRFKNLNLFFISIIFYFLGESNYFFIIIFSVFVDYFLSMGIEKYRNSRYLPRIFLSMSMLFNLGILFLFKYMNFFMESVNLFLGVNLKVLKIALPLGISFYTFQTMSYTIDVFKNKVKAERNIINFALYVSMFPQLIAGPIVKYTDIKDSLKERKTSLDNLEEGIELFIIGLFYKVFIANNIGSLYEDALNIGFSNISMIFAWLGILAFSLQIYFDFLGYSLMARGLGKLFGFSFPKNFNYPYISRSIREFWRRWHITLSNFFKEYVYISLGGNRVKGYKIYRNLFVVWLLTGLWHGASFNFIIWGLYFFMIIIFEKLLLNDFLKKHKVASHIYTIFFLLIGWSIFASDDLFMLNEMLKVLFSFNFSLDFVYYLLNYKFILVLSIVLSTPILDKFYKELKSFKYVHSISLIFCFLISVTYLVNDTYNPFLYFRF